MLLPRFIHFWGRFPGAPTALLFALDSNNNSGRHRRLSHPFLLHSSSPRSFPQLAVVFSPSLPWHPAEKRLASCFCPRPASAKPPSHLVLSAQARTYFIRSTAYSPRTLLPPPPLHNMVRFLVHLKRNTVLPSLRCSAARARLRLYVLARVFLNFLSFSSSVCAFLRSKVRI